MGEDVLDGERSRHVVVGPSRISVVPSKPNSEVVVTNVLLTIHKGFSVMSRGAGWRCRRRCVVRRRRLASAERSETWLDRTPAAWR